MTKPGKAEQSAVRHQRLSAALRENLKRRKAQARGRAEDRAGTGDEVAGNAIVETHAPDFRRNRGSD